MSLTKLIWEDGECDECGSIMKVTSIVRCEEVCNQCKLLAQLARFEYLLESNLGWR